MQGNKWPKLIPVLTPEQEFISNDFMQYWHEVLAAHSGYSFIEKFNHGYPIKKSPENFTSTLEIGAGLGEHYNYEQLTALQKENYFALELRENMADKIKASHPEIKTLVGDCQQRLNFADGYFDRVLAIHVLEHLPNLPAAIKEVYRLCNKEKGRFSIVIPCEGGWAYSLARQISAKRVFERRYKQSYHWFIQREHINHPKEILEELNRYFIVEDQSYFPFSIPLVNLNLCIGVTLKPR